MKKILLLLFLLGNLVYGQSYRLFNSGNKKLFASVPSQSETFSIAFDSVTAAGSDSVYYNFFRIRDTLIPSLCPWWGPTDCQTQDVPTWAGGKIVDNNSGLVQFFTLFNDTLNFNFNVSIGDSSVFFQDSGQKFYFRFDNVDTTTLLNTNDSALFYTIIHADAVGNPISSPLSNWQIIVGKTFGLSSFFQVDSFPTVLKPVALAGSRQPDGGFYKLTNEVLYDFQPGDEVQTHYSRYQSGGPPWGTYNFYELITVLNRTDLPDSVYYQVQRIKYDSLTFITTIDTVLYRYYHDSLVAEIPFEFYAGNKRKLYSADYCGFDLWSYAIVPDPYLGYCPEENCWGQIDTGGPAPTESTTYVMGLGMYNYSGYLFAPPPIGWGRRTNIVYFKKNGIPCGSIITGISNIQNDGSKVLISPNPATSNSSITLTYSPLTHPSEIIINNINGKEVARYALPQWSSTQTLKLPDLAAGVYVARLISNFEFQISNVKFVVE